MKKQPAISKCAVPKNIKRFLELFIQDVPNAGPLVKHAIVTPIALAIHIEETDWWPTPVCLKFRILREILKGVHIENAIG